MIEDRNTHFAADEGELGRFVLLQMTDAERTAADRHLATCASCAAAVEKERLLAAGVRRFGRNQLRSSLREDAEHTRRTLLPYARILSAAAIVLIIAGIGFYNNWFQENKDILGVEADGPTLQHETGNEGTRDVDAADSKHSLAAPRQKENAAPAASRRKSDIPAETSQGGKDEEKRMFGGKTAGTGARSEMAAASPTASQPVDQTEAYWTEGVPLGQVESPRDAGALKKRSLNSGSGEESEKAKQRRDDTKEAAQGQTSGIVNNYRIRQRPVSALPDEQRMRQQSSTQNRVQTKIEQREGMTEMTLYLDSLIDAGEVRRANVDTVSGDSLVVNMGNQRIGYKLRTGSTSQDQRHAK